MEQSNRTEQQITKYLMSSDTVDLIRRCKKDNRLIHPDFLKPDEPCDSIFYKIRRQLIIHFRVLQKHTLDLFMSR